MPDWWNRRLKSRRRRRLYWFFLLIFKKVDAFAERRHQCFFCEKSRTKKLSTTCGKVVINVFLKKYSIKKLVDDFRESRLKVRVRQFNDFFLEKYNSQTRCTFWSTSEPLQFLIHYRTPTMSSGRSLSKKTFFFPFSPFCCFATHPEKMSLLPKTDRHLLRKHVDTCPENMSTSPKTHRHFFKTADLKKNKKSSFWVVFASKCFKKS